jgi:thyroid adenoma-associated protein
MVIVMLQIHSLNILRALFRDTRLGEDVFPYVADGVKIAISGYSSTYWPVNL